MGLNVNAFAAKLARMGTRFEDEVQRALDLTADVGLRSLRGTTRFQNRTGNLRASFFAAGSGNGGVERSLSSGMGYAGFLEFGTRTITPRPFMGDAREAVTFALPLAIEDAMRRTIGG